MSDNGSLIPFPEDSPLGRACNDPIAALALVAEAMARGEKDIEPYLFAANAALKHVATHGFISLPKGDPVEVASVLERPGSPAPHELYAQTGGGEPYRRAMVQHGYVIVDADVRCGAPNGAHSCLLKRGHDGPHVHTLGEWTS